MIRKNLIVSCLFVLSCCFRLMPLMGATANLPLHGSGSAGMASFATQTAVKINPKPPLLAQRAFIIIDPGHGGHDVGTQSITKPRYQEKSLNLITAQFVKTYLQQLGYKVMMTREEDKFVSLDKRAMIANEKMPAVFVSIHYNSAPSAAAQGIEVFYYQSLENKVRTAKSKKLAQVLLKNALEKTKAKSRGVKQGNYAVIRETKMPSVLIEGGFVTNDAEMHKLKDPEYLKSLAWGIAKGIEEYLGLSQ